MNLNKYALDSSAILAVFYREPDIDLIKPLLKQSVASSVNLAECIGKMVVRGIPATQAYAALKDIVSAIIVFDENLAFMAGDMAIMTQPFGLSLGDRACLATAMHLKLEVITADKIWSKLKLPIKIKIIR